MLIPVILSGGAGARLWPVSREAFPKPFIRLADGTSLLRRTLARAASMGGVKSVITVTNREYYFLTKDEYGSRLPGALTHAALDGLDHVFLLEPVGRNTAPAIAVAALHAAARHGRDCELLVLPADHLIADEAGFARAVAAARALAARGELVTFGVPPTRPETGYGYIECGDPLDAAGGSRVARFVEKPAAARAAELIATGKALWNSGMFLFRAGDFLDALKRCDAGLHAAAAAAWRATPAADGDKVSLDPASFAALPDISVDYAVMERHDRVAVVKAGFDWNDIGSWNALSALTPADENGNRSAGEAILMDARDCYIQSESRV